MDATHSHAAPEADIVLQARGLRKEFRGFVAVGGVDLDIRRGSIHALIGPNGAGKTTVFNLLTKFLNPTSGAFSWKARKSRRSGRRRLRGSDWCDLFRFRRCFRTLQ